MLRNFGNVDLKLIRIFLKVVECGGFSQAQHELRLDLSTISNSISTLENRVGVRLCDRGRRGFKLTAAGKSLHTAAQRLYGTISEFQSAVGALADKLAGDLAIGIVDGIATSPLFALDQAIRNFESRPGDVTVRLSIGLPQDLIHYVLDGQLHLAITGAQEKQLKQLTYKKLFTEEFHFYCGRGHPLYNGPDDSRSLRHIYQFRLIAPAYIDPPMLDWSKFDSVTTVHQLEAQLIYLLSGDYVGYLPSHFADQWVRTGQLRSILPSRLTHTGTQYLIKRRNLPKTKTLAALENDILDAFAQRQRSVS